MPRTFPISFVLPLLLAGVASASTDANRADLRSLPERTARPAERKWDLTNYLNGTATEVKQVLDKEVLEFDAKCKSAEADLKRMDLRYKQEEQFLLDEVHKRPEYAEAAARLAKAQAEIDVAKSAPLEERMAASSRFNKAKGDVQRVERPATANPILVTIRKDQVALRDRIAKTDAARAKALAQRRHMTDAITNTVGLFGPIKLGKSFGVLGTVRVIDIRKDGDVLCEFKLLTIVGADAAGEGIWNIRYEEETLTMLVVGAPDASSMKVGADADIFRTYRATKWQKATTPGRPDVLVVEPYETDYDYLLKTILPLPIDVPPAPPRGPATRPAPSADPKPKPDARPKDGRP